MLHSRQRIWSSGGERNDRSDRKEWFRITPVEAALHIVVDRWTRMPAKWKDAISENSITFPKIERVDDHDDKGDEKNVSKERTCSREHAGSCFVLDLSV